MSAIIKPSFDLVIGERYNGTNGLGSLDRDCVMVVMHETDNISALRNIIGYSRDRLTEQIGHPRFLWAVSNAITSSYIRNHPRFPNDASFDGKKIKIKDVSNGQYSYVVVDKELKNGIFQLKIKFTKGLLFLPVGFGVLSCSDENPYPIYKDSFFRGEYNGRGHLFHGNDCYFGPHPFTIGAVITAEVIPLTPFSSPTSPPSPNSSSLSSSSATSFSSSSPSSSSPSCYIPVSPPSTHCCVHFFLNDVLQPVHFTGVPFPIKFYISSVHAGDEFEVLSFFCLEKPSITPTTPVAPFRPGPGLMMSQVPWVNKAKI